jgi:hypothetical protein
MAAPMKRAKQAAEKKNRGREGERTDSDDSDAIREDIDRRVRIKELKKANSFYQVGIATNRYLLCTVLENNSAADIFLLFQVRPTSSTAMIFAHISTSCFAQPVKSMIESR